MAAALRSNKALQSLSLEENNLGARFATELASALRVNKSLYTLILSYNDLGSDGSAF